MKTLNVPCWWCGKRLMESHATVEVHGVEYRVHKCCVPNATNTRKYFEVHTSASREIVEGGYRKLPCRRDE